MRPDEGKDYVLTASAIMTPNIKPGFEFTM